MRLSELLGALSEASIASIARRIVPAADDVPTARRAQAVETVLRDTGHVEQTLFSRRPPVLSIVRALLEAEGNRVAVRRLREIADAETDELCGRVAAGSLVGRDESLRIYRRIVRAAWEDDLAIDSSEANLLSLLRRELGMTVTEHFLVSYHPEIQPFWRGPSAFDTVIGNLLATGLLFEAGDEIIAPTEFVPRMRMVTGLYLDRDSSERLYGRLANDNLRDALERHHLRKVGSKPERIQRLVDDFALTPEVLNCVHIHDLQALASEAGVVMYGAKAELIDRLIEAYRSRLDLEPTGTEDEGPDHEAKALDRAGFHQLLSGLKGRALEDLCIAHGLRQSGSKDVRISTLWEGYASETTLLHTLRNPTLQQLCQHHELETRGSKGDMVQRLIAAFISTDSGSDGDRAAPGAAQS